ncbi:MAG TPA: DUF1156 domain-containing protein [Rhodocyclaceae bacterium]|nr:DUF1156 domain-containing protein [Rhodocyclaceae bacterium]
MTPIKTPKKLIEVALPLDAINAACAYEKMPGIGAHPRGIHLWWARRPLAAARAVIFAQMVNDPGYERHLGRGVNKEKAALERERLFKIIEDLVQWENINNEEVLTRAREEIWKCWRETCALNKGHPQAAELFNPDKLPAFHDPFAGGGALPLEAQRLGLESYASDLNPVAVTINKAMIEIPPRFAGRAPVGPVPAGDKQVRLHNDWSGARGLAEDVRRYGAWLLSDANKRLGQIYPRIEISGSVVAERTDLAHLQGKELKPIAWLWARTVKSPNPAFAHVDVPLVSSFVLSNKQGKEIYVQPVINGESYQFKVVLGKPGKDAENGTKVGSKGANFLCLLSKAPISGAYIKAEAKAGRIGQRLMAIVAEGPRSRLYLSPTEEHEAAASSAIPQWRPDVEFFQQALGFRVGNYGMSKWSDLFTPRQLATLDTLSSLIASVVQKVKQDALTQGFACDGRGLDAGGSGALSYAQAIAVFLAFAVDRCADFSNTVTRWVPGNQKVMNLFGKQAIAMTWDFPEAAMLENTVGGFLPAASYIADCIQTLPRSGGAGFSLQESASTNTTSANKVVSTDPPYYDNIGYADLSDFFYVWLRRGIREIFPSIFATVAVPKAEELVATPARHGGSDSAESFFLDGMARAIKRLADQAHPAFPVTIYYAFKQSDTNGEAGTSSSGWETFLAAVLEAGFAITGTWPLRSEQSSRIRGLSSNALASSVVLVCRKRRKDAGTTSRREFIRELNAVLPEALMDMTRGGINSPVAPVDLSQAIIGPGMAIFSQYAAVLEADGKPMSVRTALQLINRFLAEDDFDHDTQFCLHWFEGQGWATGKYGEADVLARAKGTSVAGLTDAGVVASGKGDLRLLKWAEMPRDWNPETDTRVPVWEALHQMIRALNQDGETAAGALLARMPARAEPIRALAYRLYTLCERKGWAEDARAYNELITAWSGVERGASEVGHVGAQGSLDI